MKKLLTILIIACTLGCNKEETNSNEEIKTPSEEIKTPDLVGTKLVITNKTTTEIAYTFTIKNIGTGRANMDGATINYNLSTQAFLSADTKYDNSDVAAGGSILGTSLGYLEANQEISRSYMSYYQVKLSNYPYLLLIIDWGKSVKESNEDNNVIYCKIE